MVRFYRARQRRIQSYYKVVKQNHNNISLKCMYYKTNAPGSTLLGLFLFKKSEELPISWGQFLNEKNFNKIMKFWCYLLAEIKT